MAKNIMYTTTLNYLQSKLKFKSFLLAFISAILLTACGVKGDLYQTPEPVENMAEASAASNVEPNAELSDNRLNEPSKTELQDQPTEPVTQPATQPVMQQETQSSNNSETEQP